MTVMELTPTEVGSGTETTTHTVVRGSGTATLPLTVVRDAVGELVTRTRGPGWRVVVREVAVLRTFRQPAVGDLLTTTVTCRPAGSDELVVSGRCVRDRVVVATVTARLGVRRFG